MRALWRSPLSVMPLRCRHVGASCFIRPRAPLLVPRFVRSVSLETGDHQSGHIEAGSNEGILFFDNVFPLKLQAATWFLPNSAFVERLRKPNSTGPDPADIVQQALPNHTSLKINKVIPRVKDGGAFVTFTHGEEVSALDVENTLRAYLKKKQVKPWWNPFIRIRGRLVQGKPWVEDLYRPPSARLKVEFVPTGTSESPALSQEQLYSLFRTYGKISEIDSQPSDSKILPKYAEIWFARVKPAIMARKYGPQSCLDDFWIFSHPRLMIPLLAALVTAITLAVFDPIRTFFIKSHITRAFHVADNWLYQWFASKATDIISFRRQREDDQSQATLMSSRSQHIEQIQAWLMETTDTFIVVQGARGSGKRELVVDQALKHRKNKLVIDCKAVQEARSDTAMINAAAQEVGYWPVFSSFNSISGLIDLAAQGATGVKTGFSETVDSQLDKILNNTASALKQIALQERRKDDKTAKMGDDEYLEANPQQRPIVIIDNFLHRSQETGVVAYDKLAAWAARLVQANIAHCIFLTTDVSFSKALSRALPDRVFRQISLGDFPPDVAKRFVTSHLDIVPADEDVDGKEIPLTPSKRREDLKELDECISSLGGRLTDLEFLARRIKAGETPKKAVKEIIDQSASEILKMYILSTDDAKRIWNPEQAWLLIKRLAAEESLRYNEIILSTPYSGVANPDSILQALEQAELISIVSSNGRPYAIRPGKPVYLPAFRLLTEDKVLHSRLDMSTINAQLKSEASSIEKCESELKLLSSLPKQPSGLAQRAEYLLAKISSSQSNIEKLEMELAKLKRVLSSEY